MKTKLNANLWRMIPKVSFANFRRLFPNCRGFNKWFSINRYWGGRIITIGVLHWQMSLDFRKDFVADMHNTP